tara:strand:- start:4990 stop:5214 length:225 start_codon:yes stop_codon:yes gene_type:complete
MNEIEINKEPVELYKILKFEGLAGSGGEAKALIEQGLILLNGVTETQKRKKIVSGDILELNKQQYKVTFNKSAT